MLNCSEWLEFLRLSSMLKLKEFALYFSYRWHQQIVYWAHESGINAKRKSLPIGSTYSSMLFHLKKILLAKKKNPVSVTQSCWYVTWEPGGRDPSITMTFIKKKRSEHHLSALVLVTVYTSHYNCICDSDVLWWVDSEGFEWESLIIIMNYELLICFGSPSGGIKGEQHLAEVQHW